MCVGVPPSSMSFLREYMDGTTQHCAEHRPLQAQAIQGARIDPGSSFDVIYEPRTRCLRARECLVGC